MVVLQKLTSSIMHRRAARVILSFYISASLQQHLSRLHIAAELGCHKGGPCFYCGPKCCPMKCCPAHFTVVLCQFIIVHIISLARVYLVKAGEMSCHKGRPRLHCGSQSIYASIHPSIHLSVHPLTHSLTQQHREQQWMQPGASHQLWLSGIN